MATSKARRRQQRLQGVLPFLIRQAALFWGWIARNPQPVTISLVLAAAVWATSAFVRKSDAFRVTTVVTPPNLSLQLPADLIGRNIWQVNLREISNQLARQRPDLKEIRVIRQLPGVIRVKAIARIPVAQARLEGWHRIDREGFILPQATAMPEERLVRFSGLGRGESALKAGRTSTDERLHAALRILGVLKRAPAGIAYRVVEINVADLQQIRFVLDGEVEVRCGTEAELSAHLARLQQTMKMLAKQPSMPVRYIDVRFQEPVIGPQT